MLCKYGTHYAIMAGIVALILISANTNFVSKAAAEEAAVTPIDSPNETAIASAADFSNTFADVAEEIMPSVVTISSAKTYNVLVRDYMPFHDDPIFDFFFGKRWGPKDEYRKYRQEGLGSGVIVSPDGYILTNAHVIDGAEEIHIHRGDEEYEAKVIGIDTKTDIAVLAIDTDEKLPAARLGNSDEIRVGEWIMAVGSPFKLEHTVTAGIISAKGRSKMGIVDYEDFIQTDAAINPGNSGGALVNLKGEIIGINTAIVSGSGGSIGIGFAIPINLAQNILQQLVENGKVVRGWLGVSIQDITSDIAEALNLSDPSGVLISSIIPDSPAEDAGIKRGDVIIEIDGIAVKSAQQLRNTIVTITPKTKTELMISRDGRIRNVDVILGEMGAEDTVMSSIREEGDFDLGLTLTSLRYFEGRKTGFNDRGVLVEAVRENSAAYRAGIRSKDIIIEVNRIPVDNPDDVRSIALKIRQNDTVLFVVWRDGNTMYLATKMK